MGRIFGLAMMAVALWAGMTVYSEGVDGLTGSVQRFVSGEARPSAQETEARSLPQRFGDAVDSEMRKREDQYAKRFEELDGL